MSKSWGRWIKNFGLLATVMFMDVSLMPGVATFAASSPSATIKLKGPSTTIMAGQSPTFTVESSGDTSGWEYQFWIDSSQGWKMVQNYSTNNHYTIQDIMPGSYEIVAYAMSSSAVKAQAWRSAVATTQFINVGSHVSLKPMSMMNNMESMEPMVQAVARNLMNPVYQFWWQGPNGHWTSSGNYSTMSMITVPYYPVSPAHAGTYHVMVYAKDGNAPATPANEIWSSEMSVNVMPTVDFQLSPSLISINAGSSASLTLSQVYPNGDPAMGMSLDNLDSIFTITNAHGQPASGFTISGFGVTNQQFVHGQYTFNNAPTLQSGTVMITAGANVSPGIYQITASDPDHMDVTSLPVHLLVNP
ncbi:hypothetical protein SAMN00768000_0875 [Sulfobacillus thermosulfidooxidans DSM 9293]|uniref:Y_Y_Y domain-containing protein n=1 Tax=Sulfobacillus thermosulfidooxidans (strain DSM 9293 / VKM B-1269 / AT-1) TaxID=929705 RepID=A0A1W1WA63_SULTA|nr:hypothetical protein [Sulfobacillus thermosulfidooxidans]SMC03039.1 hypothetical protein SAMN00768000_0875 [Sulfobacillus thermosulfidooxidans DSM 9293]